MLVDLVVDVGYFDVLVDWLGFVVGMQFGVVVGVVLLDRVDCVGEFEIGCVVV